MNMWHFKKKKKKKKKKKMKSYLDAIGLKYLLKRSGIKRPIYKLLQKQGNIDSRLGLEWNGFTSRRV